MFDWMFEEEIEKVIGIKVDDFHDWIEKTVQLFGIINRHDTIKNKILYRCYGLLRSGLIYEYLIGEDQYDKDSDVQFLTVKCWPKALEEIRKLPWVTGTAKAL